MRMTQGKPSELEAFMRLDAHQRAKLLSYAAWRREMFTDTLDVIREKIDANGGVGGFLLPVLELLRLTEVW